MNLYLIIFTSGSYKMEQTYQSHKELFMALEQHFTLHLVNHTETESIPANAYKLAFIASGGVEDAVIRNFSSLPYPITLLADGLNNSLAAALEIAACVRNKDMKVRIIHGQVADMAEQVLRHHKAFAAKRSLKGKRIGVIGTPAPWLVASHVDYLLASQRWGVNYIDIPLQEVYKRMLSPTTKSGWKPLFSPTKQKLVRTQLRKNSSKPCDSTRLSSSYVLLKSWMP